MRVDVELKETSQRLVYDDVENTYTKGPMYCLYRSGGFVTKIPVSNIWRITEDYGPTDTSSRPVSGVGDAAAEVMTKMRP